MIRKNLKLLLTIFTIVMMSFSFSFLSIATEVEVISEPSSDIEVTDVPTETPEEKPEIYSGDLYLFDTKVVMDKLVDGNVFIIGQEVDITGQINGNLFVCADKLTFAKDSYVINSIYACANSVYYDGACKDFYVVSNDIEMTFDSYVVRDLKALSSILKFKAAIGRDADLYFNSIELGEGEDIPIIYGNLRYKAPSEVQIPEGVITKTGSVAYTNIQSQNTVSSISILEILNNFLVCLATVVVIYIVIKLFIPKLSENLENEKISIGKLLKCFFIGLASIVVVTLLFILLLITQIGTKLAFILVSLFILLCLVSTPVFAIVITNILKPVLKLSKKPMFFLVLCLVSIVIYGLTLIPFIGGIFSFLINPISIGLLINMAIPHKELTDEEKTIIEEKKAQVKENKEEKKKQKAELKEAKKQAKLESKEAKKEKKEEL